MRGNYITHLWGGQNLTAVEGNTSVHQVNPVSRITGKSGGGDYVRGGLILIKRGAGRGEAGRDRWGRSICAWKL